jgi:uncharacterized protein (DUF1697 family)
MALVVFLRGVNVGGRRTFRPSLLARALERLDVVNVGAAGTFVVRRSVSRTALRAELRRRLPFETDVMICDGRDVARMTSVDPFAGQPSGPNIVRFVGVSNTRHRPAPRLPLSFPSADEWCVRVVGIQGRFAFGLYRREMRTIRYLGRLEQAFKGPLTTRNWNTIVAVARILKQAGGPRV